VQLQHLRGQDHGRLHQALVLAQNPPYDIKVVGNIGPGRQALCWTFVLYRVRRRGCDGGPPRNRTAIVRPGWLPWPGILGHAPCRVPDRHPEEGPHAVAEADYSDSWVIMAGRRARACRRLGLVGLSHETRRVAFGPQFTGVHSWIVLASHPLHGSAPAGGAYAGAYAYGAAYMRQDATTCDGSRRICR
jgi:hypothetical protein